MQGSKGLYLGITRVPRNGFRRVAPPPDLAERGISPLDPTIGEGKFRIETAQMLVKLLTIWIAPGPTMTTNSAGRTQRISGKTILTGVCAAFASIA